jgi:hypothetical protein
VFWEGPDPTQVGVSDTPQTAKKKGQKVKKNAFFLIEIGFHTLPNRHKRWSVNFDRKVLPAVAKTRKKRSKKKKFEHFFLIKVTVPHLGAE